MFPLLIRVSPMWLGALVCSFRRLGAGEHRQDLWGRAVGPGGMAFEVHRGPHEFYLSNCHFNCWFAWDSAENCYRPQRHGFLLDVRANFHVFLRSPCCAYTGALHGSAVILKPESDGKLDLPPNLLLAHYYLHDRKRSGVMPLVRNTVKEFVFQTGAVERQPERGSSPPVKIEYFLGRRRARYSFSICRDPCGRATIFGDPALPGDIEVCRIALDGSPHLYPEGAFRRWLVKESATVAVAQCEALFARIPVPFQLLSGAGSVCCGSPGDYVVTDYHPLGIDPPQIYSPERLEREFEFAK